MEKEIAQLREALVPFAKCADAIECTTTHECHDADQWAIGDLDHILKFSDLRRARAAIAPHPPEGKGE
jgi:hypothetical protein